ncbi:MULTISPECIES: hypothetical protein [unclassified Microcoleus]|uniref:hypothetical protein n=1 Tax=unclassified Microcoleus TaxID=2642155 RepID=UPI002FCF6C4D
MTQLNGAQTSTPQDLTLPRGKILISRQTLRELLSLLSLTTPIVGHPQPPDRHWNAIKSVRLARARKILRRTLAGGSKALKEEVDD